MALTQKLTFWPWFPIHSFRQFFFARTYRFATIQNVTDRRQTDNQKFREREIYSHNAGNQKGFSPSKLVPI